MQNLRFSSVFLLALFIAFATQPAAAQQRPPKELIPGEGVWIGPEKSLETWAKFLVPAGVTKVTVTLPGASRPWENVAITQ